MEFLSLVLQWAIKNYIEIIGTITGLIYLVYSVKGDIRLWFYGLLSSLFYVVVFFQSKIYADMGINVYYVVISIYGWYHWKFGKQKYKQDLQITKLTRRLIFILSGITLLLFILIANILKYFTDSDIAYWDAFITAASIVGTWMLARKILEQWLVWIVVDAISIGLYLYKELYPTVFLFVIYTVLAIFGYFEWKKLWKIQQCKV